jgi:hypothetical protein
MENLTLDKAKTLIIGILTRRHRPPEVSAIINVTNAVEAWQNAAQPQLTATKNLLPAGTSTGSCTYTIDGQAFTSTDMTKAECDVMNGNFTP